MAKRKKLFQFRRGPGQYPYTEAERYGPGACHDKEDVS